MFKTIIWFGHFAISLLTKIGPMYKVNSLEKHGKTEEMEAYIHKVTSKWAMSQLKYSGATVSVYGEDNIPSNIPVVFISNHQGNFDIPLLMSYINKPKGFIAKVETLKIPIVRTWMQYIHCVFMDRSNLRKSATAIIEGVKIIKAGHSLVIFPEGTRSKGGPLGEFKAGSFKLATKSNAPIVPITINGSYKLMEANNNRIKAANVELFIHPPIETKNLSKEEQEKLPTVVKEIIASKLHN
ncbi:MULTISPECIES: lysophospholipid acyltransferase family protein [unclassified Clostridium]|uniref:lysophospholipid acyltransferase family protein n=1 Tax=unclassified Clostridium TaxID=2614128 RepID=UPI003217E5A1